MRLMRESLPFLRTQYSGRELANPKQPVTGIFPLSPEREDVGDQTMSMAARLCHLMTYLITSI
jgi:hypothetical protein